MKRIALAIMCLMPLAAVAQDSDKGPGKVEERDLPSCFEIHDKDDKGTKPDGV